MPGGRSRYARSGRRLDLIWLEIFEVCELSTDQMIKEGVKYVLDSVLSDSSIHLTH